MQSEAMKYEAVASHSEIPLYQHHPPHYLPSHPSPQAAGSSAAFVVFGTCGVMMGLITTDWVETILFSPPISAITAGRRVKLLWPRGALLPTVLFTALGNIGRLHDITGR